MNTSRNRRICTYLISFLLIISMYTAGCSKDEVNNPVEEKMIPGEYFPVSNNYQWTYTTNAITLGQNTQFSMKIDTFAFNNGSYLAVLGRLENTDTWGSIFAIKDSGNIIYNIGDNPPETPNFLCKHQYNENEVTRETVVIGSNTFQALKYNLLFNNDTLSLWFANGIGLIREYSNKGYSLFTDDNAGHDVKIKTELVGLLKIKKP